MLGQSKTVFQAEIDSACEIIDFWRFNAHYGQELLDEQPISDHTMWNQLEYRALEGFVYAVTPFNFTSIAANLPTAPALMGNTVVWKPASSAMFSAHYLMQLLEEAGLPPGVINFVAGDAAMISNVLLVAPRSRRRALHRQHRGLQRHVEDDRRLDGRPTARIRASSAKPAARTSSSRTRRPIRRRSRRRSSAAASSSRDRSARRSAASTSRARCGTTSAIAWSAMIDDIKMGDVQDFRNFMGAVIDQRAFDKITGYIDARAQRRDDRRRRRRATRRTGYFIRPTLVETTDPGYQPLCEEIFGPVVTAYVYDDAQVDGDAGAGRRDLAVRADRRGLRAGSAARSSRRRRRCATRPATSTSTTSRPARSSASSRSAARAASGTNDKAGSKLNLVRWVSARTVKENFNPPRDYRYPFMAEA